LFLVPSSTRVWVSQLGTNHPNFNVMFNDIQTNVAFALLYNKRRRCISIINSQTLYLKPCTFFYYLFVICKFIGSLEHGFAALIMLFCLSYALLLSSCYCLLSGLIVIIMLFVIYASVVVVFPLTWLLFTSLRCFFMCCSR